MSNITLPAVAAIGSIAGMSFNETYALLGILIGFIVWIVRHYQSELKQAREENKALRLFMDENMIKVIQRKREEEL